MSTTIAIAASEWGRATLFHVAHGYLRHLPDTELDWDLSTDVPKARNTLVRRFLRGDTDRIFFLDDDHVFPRDLLEQLLSNDVPFVCSLYLTRQKPFAPVAYSERTEEGLYTALDLTQLPREGLIPVRAAGCSGMLIHREVLEAIPEPWFEYGQSSTWNASEDIVLCEKAREAGFPPVLDLRARLGHLSPCAIWPTWVDEEWAVGFSVAHDFQLLTAIESRADAQSADADAMKEEVA